MKSRSIKTNAILNIIYTLVNMLFPLITFPYVSRILLVDLLGKVNFFTNVSSYATMIASLGLSTYGIRAIARVRNDKDSLSKTTLELLIINVIATVIVVSALFFSALIVPKFRDNFILLALNCMLVFSAPLGMNWLYSGLEQYSYITKRALVFKTLSLTAIFLFVRKKDDYVYYALILVASSIGTYVCNFLYASKIITFKKYTLNFRQHFMPMLTLFASILAINVYTHLDTIMLGFINGDRDVGLYTTAVFVKTALLAMVNAVSAVLLPRISHYVSEGKRDSLNAVLNKSITVIMMISIPLTLFFMLEARSTILVLGGNDYLDAVICMQIIMPVLLISGFSNITGNQVLIPFGLDRFFVKAVASGAFVNVVLNALLMPSMGYIGAAIATLFAEVVQMSIQYIHARSYIVNNINRKSIAKIVAATLIASAVLVTIGSFCSLNAFVQIILFACIYFGIYGLCLIVFKETELLSLIRQCISLKNINRHQ